MPQVRQFRSGDVSSLRCFEACCSNSARDRRNVSDNGWVFKAASLKEQKRSVRQRSEAVREYVLQRSKGVCEACTQPAPFVRTNGVFYLEPHHTQRLADGGPDHPRWVGAVCPTCHRCIHSGKDGKQLNQTLADYLGIIEPD